MQKRLLIAGLTLGAVGAAAFGFVFKRAPEVEQVFKERGISGTFVMYEAAADTMLVWNEERATQRFAPAATFRIASALIGLDVGAVKSIDERVPYQPARYRNYDAKEGVRPYMYGSRAFASTPTRHMELRKEMRIAHSPLFRQLARQIGDERMRVGMAKLAYGNMQSSKEVDGFWRDGSLQISAVEQAQFLSKLAKGRLPVGKKALEQTRELTLQEQTVEYKLHSKSGLLNTTGKSQLGWWVGWIERENEVSSFALNVDLTGSTNPQVLAVIGRECLSALGKL